MSDFGPPPAPTRKPPQEHVRIAMERASEAADRIEAEYAESLRVATENIRTANAESSRARRAFIRALFAGYKAGLSYNQLAEAAGLDVAGVFRTMQRHGKDGKLLTPEKRGNEHTRPKRKGGK